MFIVKSRRSLLDLVGNHISPMRALGFIPEALSALSPQHPAQPEYFASRAVSEKEKDKEVKTSMALKISVGCSF
jgi:hypothetical protein